MFSRCHLPDMTRMLRMLRCALAVALPVVLVPLVQLPSTEAFAQPYSNRLPPPGWTEHPEVVYPSGYRRTVKAVPTVQRIYMWPRYWGGMPYPVDYGAMPYGAGPGDGMMPYYDVPGVSPHDPLPHHPSPHTHVPHGSAPHGTAPVPQGTPAQPVPPQLESPEFSDPGQIDIPPTNPPPSTSLDPEPVPPPTPQLEQGTLPSGRRDQARPPRRANTFDRANIASGADTAEMPGERPTQDRPATFRSSPSSVTPEFHIRDTTPPPSYDGMIEMATPGDRSQLPPATRRPLSSFPQARQHQEDVQSVDDGHSPGAQRETPSTTPVRDAIPPYSAIAKPPAIEQQLPPANRREQTESPDRTSTGRPQPETPLLSEPDAPSEDDTVASNPAREASSPSSFVLRPLPDDDETIRQQLRREEPGRGLPTEASADTRPLRPIDEGITPPGVGPFGMDSMRSVLVQPEPDNEQPAEEFRLPDVDASQPDEQIVAAFQPREEVPEQEPTLPAHVNDPHEYRIAYVEPEIERCPPCDCVDQSIDTWLAPYYCSPVRRTPEMFGDVFLSAQCEEVEVGGGALQASFPAFSLGQKIADNNNPLPRKRVYYAFNWFNDAIDYQFNGTGGATQGHESVFRHTAGVEIPLMCNAFSVEARVPIEHRVSERHTIGGDDFFYNFAGFGNVLINTKALLGECDCFAWSAGVGVELPTGQDASAGINQFVVHVSNDAVHLHPYVAFVWAKQKLFFESFTQLDITTRGNRVSLEDTNLDTTETLGRLTPSRLLFADLMAGYWLYCDDPCRKIHSLASLVEVHYVSTLDPGEALEGFALGGEYFFCNGAVHNGGIDTVNLTLGLHAECGPCSAFRVAGAFPVTDDQLFSSELIFQFNRRL